MDPSFIFTVAHAMQQQTLAKNVALGSQYELSEKERQAAILEDRRKIRDEISDESTYLLHQAAAYPKETLVITRLRMYEMETSGVIPDSFEDIGEKEKTALLWKKLSNILERCSSDLTEEMKQDCTRCLDAISLKIFVRAVAERIDAYQTYLIQKPKYEKYNKLCKFSLLFVFGLPVLVFILVFLFSKIPFPDNIHLFGLRLPDFLLMTAFVVELLMIGFYNIVKGVYYCRAKQVLDHYSRKSHAEAVQFWEDAKKQFNGIPNGDDLLKCWKEQEAIIEPFFKEYPPYQGANKTEKSDPEKSDPSA